MFSLKARTGPQKQFWQRREKRRGEWEVGAVRAAAERKTEMPTGKPK